MAALVKALMTPLPAVRLTAPTSVANMDAAEHDFWSVTIDHDAGRRPGAPHRWARTAALTAPARAPARV
jgi:hypothetical protein